MRTISGCSHIAAGPEPLQPGQQTSPQTVSFGTPPKDYQVWFSRRVKDENVVMHLRDEASFQEVGLTIDQEGRPISVLDGFEDEAGNLMAIFVNHQRLRTPEDFQRNAEALATTRNIVQQSLLTREQEQCDLSEEDIRRFKNLVLGSSDVTM